MWHCWETSLMQILPAMKKKPRRKGRRVPIQEDWCLRCGIKTYREVCEIQGKIRSTRLLIERRNKLRRDICIQWELRHMIGILMCANWRRSCMSLEGTHGITHTWGAWISPRVMNILTFATRLKMKSYRGWQAYRWVQEEILKRFNMEDIGIQWP